MPNGLTLSTSGTISGTPTNTGTYTFTVTVADASGCSGSRAYTITVSPGVASVELTDLTHTYDATPKAATVTTTPPGLPVDVTYDGSPAAPTAPGSYAVEATITDPNYLPASDSGTLVIAQRPLTITADTKTKLVGDPDPTLTWQLTGGSLAGSDTISGELSREPGETAGTYAILQNTLSAGPNYALTFVGADLTIDLGTSTTTLTAAPASAAVGTSITLTASVAAVPPSTATPTGTVTFTDGATTLCAAVPLDGSGEATCVVTAALPEGTHTAVATYSGDGAVSGSAGNTDFVITGIEPTITVPPTMNATYGDPASFTITATGTPTPSLTLTGTLPAGLAYLDNGDGTATISGTPTAIGSATVTVEATNAAGSASDSGTIVVAERPITITADAQSKLVGAPDPTLTWSITSGSVVGSDTISGELSREPGETAGTYAILQNTLDAGPNYAMTFVGANLTIGIAASTTVVTATPSTASAGTTIELSATVTADPPSTTIPSGTVTFTEGATALCAATLDAAGAATCSFTATLPAGDHLITATYEGDEATASSSGTTTLSVSGSEPAIVTPDTMTFTAGASQTFTITTSGTPTPVLSTVGTLPPGVTFIDNGDGTAILTGSIPTTGNWPITVVAENAAGTATADIVIVSAAAAIANVPTLDPKALLMLAVAIAAIATFTVGRIGN